jgi:hypothetical protein
MAYGDIRLVSFIWAKWLLTGDSLIGTPTITSVAPIASATLIGIVGSTVTVAITAGNYSGTGQVSCKINTTDGEEATRTVFIPVVPLTS